MVKIIGKEKVKQAGSLSLVGTLMGGEIYIINLVDQTGCLIPSIFAITLIGMVSVYKHQNITRERISRHKKTLSNLLNRHKQ